MRKQGLEFARYLDLKLFSAWIIQNGVIDFIFRENPHSELIKRSYHILYILAQDEQTFPLDIVNNIWSCCVQKHEDIVRASFELITELSKCLPVTVLQAFFHKIQTLDQFDQKTVNFLQDYFVNSIQNLIR